MLIQKTTNIKYRLLAIYFDKIIKFSYINYEFNNIKPNFKNKPCSKIISIQIKLKPFSSK